MDRTDLPPAGDPGLPVGFAAAGEAAAHVFASELADRILVDGEDGHHLQRVRRLRVGERVTVADDTGRWRPYEIVRSDRGSLGLVVAGDVAREPRLLPPLAVAFALSKGTKPEQVVTGLTELGVDRILPLRSRRSIVRWEGERARAATARLRRVAREAAMQCRRARLPVVEEPTDVGGLPAGGVVVVGDARGAPVQGVPLPPLGSGWLAVVGPEGGLDPEERETLAARPGAVAVAVGPHVLRAETAGVALAAALTARRTADRRHGG